MSEDRAWWYGPERAWWRGRNYPLYTRGGNHDSSKGITS
jgi:hypothetical protein